MAIPLSLPVTPFARQFTIGSCMSDYGCDCDCHRQAQDRVLRKKPRPVPLGSSISRVSSVMRAASNLSLQARQGQSKSRRSVPRRFGIPADPGSKRDHTLQRLAQARRMPVTLHWRACVCVIHRAAGSLARDKHPRSPKDERIFWVVSIGSYSAMTAHTLEWPCPTLPYLGRKLTCGCSRLGWISLDIAFLSGSDRSTPCEERMPGIDAGEIHTCVICTRKLVPFTLGKNRDKRCKLRRRRASMRGGEAQAVRKSP